MDVILMDVQLQDPQSGRNALRGVAHLRKLGIRAPEQMTPLYIGWPMAISTNEIIPMTFNSTKRAAATIRSFHHLT
jgi:hypothetical protein